MNRIRVTVERIDGHCNQPMLVGDTFTVHGGKLRIPDGKFVCIWALQSMMPIFPLLERADAFSSDDWTRKAVQFCCPDPKGRVHYRIERIPEQ